jgi:predicted nuclease of predicted toxin-antitoxin system
MRLLLDESIPIEAASRLRDAGHSVATAAGRNLEGAGDAVILAACRREGRTFLTLDTAFARTAPAAGPRIVALDVAAGHPQAVLDLLNRLLPLLDRPQPPEGTWVARPNGETVDMSFGDRSGGDRGSQSPGARASDPPPATGHRAASDETT